MRLSVSKSQFCFFLLACTTCMVEPTLAQSLMQIRMVNTVDQSAWSSTESLAQVHVVKNTITFQNPSAAFQDTFNLQEDPHPAFGLYFEVKNPPANMTFSMQYVRPDRTVALDIGTVYTRIPGPPSDWFFINWQIPSLDVPGLWSIALDIDGMNVANVPFTVTGCPVTVTIGTGYGGTIYNPYMLAQFTAPRHSGTILKHATSCGFTEFNWQQEVATLPCPSPFYALGAAVAITNLCPQTGSLTAGSLPTNGPPFPDPPRGGYTAPQHYVGYNPYPFYYDMVAVAEPGWCTLTQFPLCGPHSIFPYILNEADQTHEAGTTLSFLDDPSDPCLPGGNSNFQARFCGGSFANLPFLSFRTTLVGVSPEPMQGSVSCGPSTSWYCTPLYSWTWQSTFNGTAGAVSQTASFYPIDPGSGTGGVTITGINGVQLPPAVPPTEIATTASGLAYSRVSQTFNGTVTLRNISTSAISGPLQILFFGMPANVTLVNATNNLSGTPYLTIPSVTNLATGHSVTIGVQFKNVSNAIINFTPVIYSGSIN